HPGATTFPELLATDLAKALHDIVVPYKKVPLGDSRRQAIPLASPNGQQDYIQRTVGAALQAIAIARGKYRGKLYVSPALVAFRPMLESIFHERLQVSEKVLKSFADESVLTEGKRILTASQRRRMNMPGVPEA